MNEIDEIRQDMARIRYNLHGDLKGVITEAERILDWRRQIRNAPWLWVGLALGAGYLLVPRRSRPEPRVVAIEEVADHLPNMRGMEQTRPTMAASLGITPWRVAWWGLKTMSPLLLAAGQSYLMPWVEQMIARSQSSEGGRGPGAGDSIDQGVGSRRF